MGLNSSQLPADIIRNIQTEEDLDAAVDNLNNHDNIYDEEVETIETQHLDIVVQVVSEDSPNNESEDGNDSPNNESEEGNDLNNSLEEEGLTLDENVEVEESLTLDENVEVPYESIEFVLQDEKTETCTICEKECGEDYRCDECSKYCHVSCSAQNENGLYHCLFCKKALHIKEQRLNSKRKQEQQAENMLNKSNKRFKQCEEGSCVTLPVPDVDRGRGDFRNVMGVIMGVKSNGLYQIGTHHGTLEQLYSRNQFSPWPTEQIFITIDQVPGNNITLREVARLDSNGTGQGFIRCSCKSKCTGRGKCLKANIICNSKCHAGNICNNK